MELGRRLTFDDWTPGQVAKFGAVLDDDERTWDWLKRKGDAAHDLYWKTAPIYRIADPADFQIAVPQLLSHGRPFTALQVIHLGLVRTPDLPSNLVFDTLDAIRRPNADQRPQDVGYEIVELLKNLQNQEPPVDRGRLAEFEWQFLDVLDGNQASAKTLHSFLSQEPESFAGLFKLIFRPKPETDAREQNLPNRKAVGRSTPTDFFIPGQNFQDLTQPAIPSMPSSSANGSTQRGSCAVNRGIWRFATRTLAKCSPTLRKNPMKPGLAPRCTA